MSNKTILVVDDEEDTVELASLILSYEGYKVLTANDGEEAINLLKTNEEIPDLILLDILMPKMSGLDVCKWIKSQDHLKSIPVLFFTAKVGAKDKEEGLNAGGDDYIVKPFSTKDLFEIIKRHLKE